MNEEMSEEFSKAPTCKEVCVRCCAERGNTLRWGFPEDEECDNFYMENSFYCPVTRRTIHHPEDVGTVQPDCPRKFEHLRSALSLDKTRQKRLFELEHESYSPERLKYGVEERVFLERWKKRNRRVPGINRGYTLLEHILCKGDQAFPEQVSQRDAYVAASVIQWLGTNCGKAFLADCEEEIPEAKKASRVALRMRGEPVW